MDRDIQVAMSGMLVFVIGMGAWLVYDINKQSNRRTQYVEQHKCVRVGFAGKDAQGIYRCDTGLFLWREIGKTM